MKDRQNEAQGTKASVQFLSPILHWLAMPAIVFLRSGFGYSYLSSKGVFLIFAWASGLYCLYSWIAEGAWSENRAIALFAVTASFLYIVHLIHAFTRETRRAGKHDAYSGTSHILRLPGLNQHRSNPQTVTAIHLWLEPFLIFVAAAVLKAFAGEGRLSKWLLIVAAGLWLKEFINYWYSIRSEKKYEDIMEDAGEKMPGGGDAIPIPQAGGRKPRVKRAPISAQETAGNAEQERRFAEVLRLMPPHPPYDLQQAERNYRELMKAFHPDTDDTVVSGKAAELNEAIEYFRSRTASRQ